MNLFSELPEQPKQRVYIGIDNGVSGSIGIIKEDGSYTFVSTPVRQELSYTQKKQFITRIVTGELYTLLSIAGPDSMVMIERPMVNPGRFGATVSALRAFEATLIVIEALGLAYETCDSKQWQKALFPNGTAGAELKKASLQIGARLYPNTLNHLHDDRDGILIAHHCKQKHK